MEGKKRATGIVRCLLSTIVVLAGLSATWAWGEVARLAEPVSPATPSHRGGLYGIWQPDGARQPGIFRSSDGGQTWEPLSLPSDAVPSAWAQRTSSAGAEYLAVATGSTTLVSLDGGDSWAISIHGLDALSLAWGADDSLYLGTDGQGVHRVPAGSSHAVEISAPEAGLASEAVTDLALAPGRAPLEGRLFAAIQNQLFYTDDWGRTWQRTAPVEDWISTLAVVSAEEIYVGTETTGVYRSLDAGQSWQPAREGLGLAAGQMVNVTALRADPELPGVLYVTIDHLLGGTQLHGSAAGAFVSLDGGTCWQPLAGPAFPEAEHASDLVLLPERPLHVQAVTAHERQAYAPDITAAVAALQSTEPASRATAARLLGAARATEAGDALLAALADPAPEVSLAASRALGQIADPAMAGSLLVALEHPTAEVRLGAARALGMMRSQAAVEPLRSMFVDGVGQELTVTAEALGQIGSPEAFDALLVALGDLTLSPRRHAAMAALEAAGEPAVEPLVLSLASPSSHIRRNAAETLGWIGAPSATEALLRAARKDHDAEVRARAVWALGEIAEPRARATLARAAAKDPALRVRSAAEQALADMGEQTTGRSAIAAGWATSLAPALNRLQPLRWLLLAFSLVAAGWLAVGHGRLIPLTVPQRRKNS